METLLVEEIEYMKWMKELANMNMEVEGRLRRLIYFFEYFESKDGWSKQWMKRQRSTTDSRRILSTVRAFFYSSDVTSLTVHPRLCIVFRSNRNVIICQLRYRFYTKTYLCYHNFKFQFFSSNIPRSGRQERNHPAFLHLQSITSIISVGLITPSIVSTNTPGNSINVHHNCLIYCLAPRRKGTDVGQEIENSFGCESRKPV